jgi:hypothetical protein
MSRTQHSFKSAKAGPSKVNVQYRKNLQIYQAMTLYLRHHIGMPLDGFKSLALDVHGRCENTFCFLSILLLYLLDFLLAYSGEYCALPTC